MFAHRFLSSSLAKASVPTTMVRRAAMSTTNNGKPFPPVEQTMLPSTYAACLHAKSSSNTWFYINAFFVIPGMFLAIWWLVPGEMAHIQHKYDHPNEYVPWQHMKKQKNAFPWGTDPLFKNDAFVPNPPAEE
ncbi:hypothetical protein BASA50_008958 [Batrachochytrium salamandrivorans]|uniref:Cytochrome c oxidase subunit VIa n=1 Tax=Batrachochytrium salamandrivorans TaxID=1357716 RepID=A0ABQ8F2H5_9FUNG|nr:hypothetical protein BASA62_007372 [Batrachochytrium salamandrivorans]KAH6572182.1 hypothetical protein BASA60_006742 [Batrachochytrium salamandrivorans]KAH6590958.1 hypothetical protein BASA50_008958 [Batrachochytrium salamandrivorans]KAH6601877.1 hypothetical protein BASA61_001677 [Batrachochytrium salamandrivorans]KAH9268558.1 hypothetical protein BASA84_000163 [Batrachochytrium salamandrivorans]